MNNKKTLGYNAYLKTLIQKVNTTVVNWNA